MRQHLFRHHPGFPHCPRRGGNTREKLRVKHVGPFDITGKPMKGWFMVEIRGWKTVDDLKAWLSIGSDYALTLLQNNG